MAHSGASHGVVSPATVIAGTPVIRWVKLVATDKPGQWEYFTGARAATKYVETTCDMMKPFLVEFKPRGSAASARKDVDDAYATTDAVPLILAGRNGPLTVVGFCTNPGADLLPGTIHDGGATAGSLTKGTAQPFTGVINAETVANTHTVGTFLMY